jgi:hypothetical protein
MLKSSLVSVLTITLWCTASVAQPTVPPLISFQGYLTNDSGSPIDSAASMMFAMHTDSVSGTQLWNETQVVSIVDGLFEVHLGADTAIPDSVFDRSEVYLAVKVADDPWMTPRQRLTSSAWAFKAGCTLSIWYEDSDGDTYGDDSSTRVSCTAPAGFVSDNTDCDDVLSSINPGASEQCNGLDDDCCSVPDDGGALASCDDDEQCTVDTCTGFSGCLNDPTPLNGSACDDGDPCFDGETCSGGTCGGGSNICVFAPECYVNPGSCTNNQGTPSCDYDFAPSGTSCTGGTCDGAGDCVVE